MKPNTHNPLHVVNSNDVAKEASTRPFQSPYLKAILSGAARALNATTMIRMIDDRAAASRYIKQTGFMRG